MSAGKDRYPLEPASRNTVRILIGIALACDGLAIIIFWMSGLQPGAIVGMAVAVFISSLFFWFAVAQRKSNVTVDNQALQLHLPLYGRRIPLQKINADQIRTLQNLPASPYRLRWRLNGLGVPCYSLGWFSSHDKGRILASITTPEVLMIPTHDKYSLLLSIQNPEALTAGLQSPEQSPGSPGTP